MRRCREKGTKERWSAVELDLVPFSESRGWSANIQMRGKGLANREVRVYFSLHKTEELALKRFCK